MAEDDRGAIERRLDKLEGWSYDGSSLRKTYELAGFPEAIAFMLRSSIEIDRLDHHPEWTNVYNRVEVSLSSHDVGGVTDRDFALAQILDAAAGS